MLGPELYMADAKRVSASDFHKFLTRQSGGGGPSRGVTGATLGETEEKIRAFLRPNRDVQEPFMEDREFVDWLFSKENSVYDGTAGAAVNQVKPQWRSMVRDKVSMF